MRTLANELSDAVADKEQNIKHMKAVMKLLGDRTSLLEKENKEMRRQLGIVSIKNDKKVEKSLQNGK